MSTYLVPSTLLHLWQLLLIFFHRECKQHNINNTNTIAIPYSVQTLLLSILIPYMHFSTKILLLANITVLSYQYAYQKEYPINPFQKRLPLSKCTTVFKKVLPSYKKRTVPSWKKCYPVNKRLLKYYPTVYIKEVKVRKFRYDAKKQLFTQNSRALQNIPPAQAALEQTHRAHLLPGQLLEPSIFQGQSCLTGAG